MIRIHNYLILVSLTALLLVAAGCQQEEVSSLEGASKGKIVLNLSPGEVFVDVETRAVPTSEELANYIFKLNGADVSDDLRSGAMSLVIEAGSYTLSVENMSQTAAQAGNGKPYYKKEVNFELSPGETKPLEIELGAPKNAKVSLAVEASFSALYENAKLTYSDGTRTVEVTTADPGYFMVPESGGTLTFSLSAKGKNHAQEIVGASISVAVEAGKYTTVTLSAKAINDEWVIIPVVSGEHSREFDVKGRKL